MQRIDEQKRKRILETAGRLFAARPFHEVRLEDVAAEAHIGKGTIYIYFQSKADLCFSLLLESMVEVINATRAEAAAAGTAPLQKIERLVHTFMPFTKRLMYLRSMERELGLQPEQMQALEEKRLELLGLVEGVLREGIAAGEIDDPHPDLTSRYLLAIFREITYFPNPDVAPDVLMAHILHVLRRGILKRAP